MNIDRNLNLKDPKDREYFYNQLENESNLPSSPELVRKSIDFILCYLADEEWLKIYPVPSLRGEISVGITIGQSRINSLDFFYEIIPLGINLIQLQGLKGFDRIVNSLDVPSYERLSTLFEVRIAATYKGSGYKVELEPENGKDGLKDVIFS